MSKKRNLIFYIKTLFSASIALSFVNAVEKVVALTILPVFTYYLSPKDFGIISLVQSTAAFLSIIYNPGTLSATVRLYYDKDFDDERKKLFGSTLVFFLILPILLIVISFFYGDYLFNKIFNQFSFWPYGILALVLALLIQPTRLWTSLYTIQFRITKIAKWSIISFIIGVIISLLFVIVFKLDAIGRLLGIISGNLVLFVVGLIALKNYTNFKHSRSVFKETFFLGLPLTIGVWAYVILDISDRYIIERLLNIDSVGIYDIGYKMATIPIIISIGFKQVWAPIFFENMKSNNKFVISKLATYFILIFSAFCGIFILFSKELIELLINQRFHSAIQVIPWITLGIFFFGLVNVFSTTLDYEKKFISIGVIALISAIMNVILNLILIKYFNITGAAIATCFAYFAYLLIVLMTIKKVFAEIFEIKKILFSVLFLIVAFFISVLISGNIILIKIIMVVIWIYILIYTNFIFTKFEKEKIKIHLKAVLKNKRGRKNETAT